MPDKLPVPDYIGPFLGYVTDTSVKIWIHDASLREGQSRKVYVRVVHPKGTEKIVCGSGSITLSESTCWAGVTEIDHLSEKTYYEYQFFDDEGATQAIQFPDLDGADLAFWTLPELGYSKQLDFLLMSCHNPTKSTKDRMDGYRVWSRLPEIVFRENDNVRFAILGGDQIYADSKEYRLRHTKNPHKRLRLYLDLYRDFWSNEHYKKVLCSLPSVLMWDDHDIIDGWGSRYDSYGDLKKPGKKKFKPRWLDLFESARIAFQHMQASRNPPPLSEDYKAGFDTCFRVGDAAFVLADLRSNRVSMCGVLWTGEQFSNVKQWVKAQRENLNTLFFVSPVVFSHGSPKFEGFILRSWQFILWLIWLLKWVGRILFWFPNFITMPLAFLFTWIARAFNNSAGDLRDDVDDSWGSERNQQQTDEVLEYLFGLQNPKDGKKAIKVVILSGDIHAAGYSTLYSKDPAHSVNPQIQHIVSSPVAYSPFPWIGEAAYRNSTKYVPLGAKGVFGAQVSHHFTTRNVAIVSLRKINDAEDLLKVKFYLEEFPEPQILTFCLDRASHLENVNWL